MTCQLPAENKEPATVAYRLPAEPRSGEAYLPQCFPQSTEPIPLSRQRPWRRAGEPFATASGGRCAEMNWAVLSIPLGEALVLAATGTRFRTVVRTGLRASGG